MNTGWAMPVSTGQQKKLEICNENNYFCKPIKKTFGKLMFLSDVLKNVQKTINYTTGRSTLTRKTS